VTPSTNRRAFCHVILTSLYRHATLSLNREGVTSPYDVIIRRLKNCSSVDRRDYYFFR